MASNSKSFEVSFNSDTSDDESESDSNTRQGEDTTACVKITSDQADKQNMKTSDQADIQSMKTSDQVDTDCVEITSTEEDTNFLKTSHQADTESVITSHPADIECVMSHEKKSQATKVFTHSMDQKHVVSENLSENFVVNGVSETTTSVETGGGCDGGLLVDLCGSSEKVVPSTSEDTAVLYGSNNTATGDTEEIHMITTTGYSEERTTSGLSGVEVTGSSNEVHTQVSSTVDNQLGSGEGQSSVSRSSEVEQQYQHSDGVSKEPASSDVQHTEAGVEDLSNCTTQIQQKHSSMAEGAESALTAHTTEQGTAATSEQRHSYTGNSDVTDLYHNSKAESSLATAEQQQLERKTLARHSLDNNKYNHDEEGVLFGNLDSRSNTTTEFGLKERPKSSSRRKAGAGGEVSVLCEDDGSRSYEKTTTYIAGGKESTDDLIKRILAEARGEVVSPPRQRSLDKPEMESASLRLGGERYSRDYGLDGETSSRDHGLESASRRLGGERYSRDYGLESTSARLEEERSSEDRALLMDGSDNPWRSRLDRGLASEEQPMDTAPRSRYVEQEEYQQESSMVRRGAGHHHQPDPYHDMYDVDSQGSSGYRPRHFRSNLMRKQQAILHDDEWSDEEDSAYRKEQQVPYIPDEEFIPQKGQDTDQVVQEKSEQIRDVVDKQSSVLQQLKSASDSFEEMSAEIKELKQHFLDSQIRRSMILDEIEHERMMMEQSEHESGHKPVGYQSQRRRYGVQEAAEEDEYDFKPHQFRPTHQQRTVTLDKELEADTLGSRGGLTGLAVGSSTTSPLDTFRHKLSERYQTALSGSAFTSSSGSHGLDSNSSSNKYQSLYDEEPAPTRRNGGSSRGKYTLTRSYGALDDSEEQDSSREQMYRSPNLPSYRKYDYDKKDYSGTELSSDLPSYRKYDYDNKRDYTSSSRDYLSESRPLSSGGGGASSRYSSLPRSKTLDYSSVSTARTSRQLAPTEPAFSSRFLDKVREKKACGEQSTRDKPFTSRFLGKSFDTESTFHKSSSTKTYGKSDDVSKYNGNSETASTGE